MTAPQAKATTPTPRTRKRDPKNAEALAGAKKVADALPAPEEPAAKKQPAEAPATKAAPAKARELATVGALPEPVALDWTEKDGVHRAVSGRWKYRVKEGQAGGWFAEGGTGSPVPLHGDPQATVDAAKTIAETVDAGAKWCVWARYRVMPWAEIQKVAAEASHDAK